jgi:hypothetical protein
VISEGQGTRLRIADCYQARRRRHQRNKNCCRKIRVRTVLRAAGGTGSLTFGQCLVRGAEATETRPAESRLHRNLTGRPQGACPSRAGV